MYRPLQIAISAQSCRLSNQQRKVLVHDILLSVCMCIRICTSAKGPAFLRGELDPQGSIFTPPFRSIPQSFPSWTGCLAGQIKQRLVFLIHNRKVRVTCIIPQRVPKQIQLLPANRRTCHFFPVVSRIRYRWDRCAKVISADRVAGFSYPDLCAWFCLSDDSTDVVDGFPEYRFGSGDFGVLEVRVAVGANEVGCFDYLFFLIIYKFKSQEGTKEINRCQKKKKKKRETLRQHFRVGPTLSMYPHAQPIWLLLPQKQVTSLHHLSAQPGNPRLSPFCTNPRFPQTQQLTSDGRIASRQPTAPLFPH